jgi:hypothetical protein
VQSVNCVLIGCGADCTAKSYLVDGATDLCPPCFRKKGSATYKTAKRCVDGKEIASEVEDEDGEEDDDDDEDGDKDEDEEETEGGDARVGRRASRRLAAAPREEGSVTSDSDSDGEGSEQREEREDSDEDARRGWVSDESDSEEDAQKNRESDEQIAAREAAAKATAAVAADAYNRAVASKQALMDAAKSLSLPTNP